MHKSSGLKSNRYVNYVDKYKELVERLLILLENPVRVYNLVDGKRKYHALAAPTDTASGVATGNMTENSDTGMPDSSATISSSTMKKICFRSGSSLGSIQLQNLIGQLLEIKVTSEGKSTASLNPRAIWISITLKTSSFATFC